MKFYHFTFSHLVGTEISAKILEVFDKGLTEYLMFPEERYLQKSKKLGEIIKLFNMPPFILKSSLKRMTPTEFLPKKRPTKLVDHRRKLI